MPDLNHPHDLQTEEDVFEANPDAFVVQMDEGYPPYRICFSDGSPMPLSDETNERLVRKLFNDHSLQGHPIQEVASADVEIDTLVPGFDDPSNNAHSGDGSADAADEVVVEEADRGEPDADGNLADRADARGGEDVVETGADQPAGGGRDSMLASESPSETSPAEVEDESADDAPVERGPVEDASVEDAPAEDAPAEDAPVEDIDDETAALRDEVVRTASYAYYFGATPEEGVEIVEEVTGRSISYDDLNLAVTDIDRVLAEVRDDEARNEGVRMAQIARHLDVVPDAVDELVASIVPNPAEWTMDDTLSLYEDLQNNSSAEETAAEAAEETAEEAADEEAVDAEVADTAEPVEDPTPAAEAAEETDSIPADTSAIDDALNEAEAEREAAQADAPSYQNGVAVEDDDEMQLMIRFQIEARVLTAALEEVLSTYKDEGPGYTLFSAISNPNGYFASQDMIADEVGDGRLVLGTYGSSERDYHYVDVEAFDVEAEGRFIISNASRVLNWANHMQGIVTITHYRDVMDRRFLVMESANSRTPVEERVPIYFEGDVEETFPAILERFETPTQSFDLPLLLEGVQRAQKVRTSGESTSDARSTDIHWRGDKAEFTAMMGQDDKTIASAIKAPLTNQEGECVINPFDFRWEADADVLRTLRDTLRGNNTRFSVDHTQLDEQGEPLPPVMQIYYEKSAGRGAEPMKAHRQLEILSEDEPFRNAWLDPDETAAEAVFSRENCRLWASMPVAQLDPMVKQIFAVYNTSDTDSVVPELRRNPDDSTVRLVYEDFETGEATIPAAIGTSEVETFRIDAGIYGALQAIVGDRPEVQLYSYPDPQSDRELTNGVIIVPITEDSDPTVPVTDPDRYMIVNWSA
jgi:hypothetical protein